MMPTRSAFTSTLSFAPSLASTLVSAIPAARDTAVGAPSPGGALAPMLSTLMIRPQRRARIPGIARRLSRMAAKSFRSRSACQSASEISAKGPRWLVPALLTRMSTCPNAASASRKARSHPSAVEMSAAIDADLRAGRRRLQLGLGLGERIRPARHQRHLAARPGKGAPHRQAQPLGAAGDQRRAAFYG